MYGPRYSCDPLPNGVDALALPMPSLWRLALANKQIGIAFVFLVMTVTDETCIGKDIPKAYWFYAKVEIARF